MSSSSFIVSLERVETVARDESLGRTYDFLRRVQRLQR
jgi:hypothetical protein